MGVRGRSPDNLHWYSFFILSRILPMHESNFAPCQFLRDVVHLRFTLFSIVFTVLVVRCYKAYCKTKHKRQLNILNRLWIVSKHTSHLKSSKVCYLHDSQVGLLICWQWFNSSLIIPGGEKSFSIHNSVLFDVKEN